MLGISTNSHFFRGQVVVVQNLVALYLRSTWSADLRQSRKKVNKKLKKKLTELNYSWTWSKYKRYKVNEERRILFGAISAVKKPSESHIRWMGPMGQQSLSTPITMPKIPGTKTDTCQCLGSGH